MNDQSRDILFWFKLGSPLDSRCFMSNQCGILQPCHSTPLNVTLMSLVGAYYTTIISSK